ncbi:unnamed protein product [Caenorhabditis auriculariae]|uniref:Uncharacterized protein n=1 Tax=Caenorhabditis auriculariae TaxID=2777116 RepID=A0A8S1HU69_9PELO|nr:unnamed protein product [Caenorhabditis auriculariae]
MLLALARYETPTASEVPTCVQKRSVKPSDDCLRDAMRATSSARLLHLNRLSKQRVDRSTTAGGSGMHQVLFCTHKTIEEFINCQTPEYIILY